MVQLSESQCEKRLLLITVGTGSHSKSSERVREMEIGFLKYTDNLF